MRRQSQTGRKIFAKDVSDKGLIKINKEHLKSIIRKQIT